MELNKLKKLLAEGNPDKQLDNIIESLSTRHDLRAKIKDKNAMETKAEIAEIMAKVGTENIKDINAANPALGAKIMKNNFEADATEDQATLYQNLANAARKRERKENIDPLSGGKISEGIDNINIKFGNKVEKVIDSNKQMKENIKEEDLMKKEQKAIFEQSMADIFKMLKEGDDEMTEEELMVGKVPAVESPEVEQGQELIQAEEPVLEPELQANDADVAIAEPAMESPIVDIPTDVQPEVSLTNNSIRIEIPIVGGESIVDEVSAEEADALQEALRTVYRILGNNMLLENEDSVEIPADAQADLKTENGKLVIEIPLENPIEEITQSSADALQEAINVISFLLKEELTPEEEHGVRKLLQAKEEEYGVDFNGNGVVEPSQNPKVTDEDLELVDSMVTEPHEIVQVPTDVPADVTVHSDSIRVELPLIGNINDNLEGEEALQEAFKFIYSVFKSQNLNEAEGVEIPESAEAEITVEDGKLVINIPIDSPKEEVSPEEALALQEAFDYISFSLNERINRIDPSTGLPITTLVPPGAETIPFTPKVPTVVPTPTITPTPPVTPVPPAAPTGPYIPATPSPTPTNIPGTGTPPGLPVGDVPPVGGEGFFDKAGNFIGGVYDSAAKGVSDVLGTMGTTLSGPAETLGAIGSGAMGLAGAAGNFLMTNPYALSLALGISVATAASYIAKGGIPRFLHKKLGLFKRGQKYKELEKQDNEKIKARNSAQLAIKDTARKNFLDAKARQNLNVTNAKKGLTFGSQLLSKIPLINKLGNFKIFQNQDIKDKMVRDKEAVINKYSSPAELQRLASQGLKFDPKTGKVEYDYTKLSTLTQDEQDKAAMRKLEIADEMKKTGDYSSAVTSIKDGLKSAKETRELELAKARQAQATAMDAADLEIEKNRLLKKDKDLEEIRYQKTMNEGFEFDVKLAYSLLEDTPFSEEEKLNIITEAYNDLYFVNLRKNLQESGYSVSQKGVSLFLESKGVDISMEEKDGLMKSLNSESVIKDFEEHYQAKRHSDIKSEEMTNKDMNYGKSSTEVTPPIIQESEKAKKPHTEELNHGGSDTIDSTGKLATDKKASEKEESFTVKAEPTDVTIKEAAKYRSLKEAFLLESDYFEKDSSSVVSAGDKKNKLVSQLGLLVARDVQDPLYEELIRATAVSKRLQEELQSKYKAVALKKAGDLLSSKSKKK
jgi:hypothetical protein